MPSTIKRSSPRSASVRASRLSGEGSTAGCSGSLLSRAALTSHKLMELRTPVRCLRTRGQLDELLPPFLSPSPSTLTFPSDSVSTALAPAVECARPHVWGGTGRPIACGSTCSHAAMEVCSSQMVGASRFSVEALFPRFEGAVNAYARRERGTLGPPSMSLQATARNPTESVRTLCIHTGRRVGYRAAFGSRELGYHAHIRPLECPPPHAFCWWVHAVQNERHNRELVQTADWRGPNRRRGRYLVLYESRHGWCVVVVLGACRRVAHEEIVARGRHGSTAHMAGAHPDASHAGLAAPFWRSAKPVYHSASLAPGLVKPQHPSPSPHPQQTTRRRRGSSRPSSCSRWLPPYRAASPCPTGGCSTRRSYTARSRTP